MKLVSNTKWFKVVRGKYGKRKVWGETDGKTIYIDERAIGKKELEIIVHEALHCISPTASEDDVERSAITLTNTLWREGYRKIDNRNNTPLQDGKIHK
jgi:hypothetical protein